MSVFILGAGTYLFGVLSGLVPFMSAELYLLGAAALAPPELQVVLVVMAALGQMTGKAGMYGLGRGVFNVSGPRFRSWRDRAEAWTREKGGPRKLLIALSAVIGLPPFYLISIACGATRAPFSSFFALGLSGRLIRFGTIALLPVPFEKLRLALGI